MRRSAFVAALLAVIVLGSRPDAMCVPAPRTPDSTAHQRSPAAPRRSTPSTPHRTSGTLDVTLFGGYGVNSITLDDPANAAFCGGT